MQTKFTKKRGRLLKQIIRFCLLLIGFISIAQYSIAQPIDSIGEVDESTRDFTVLDGSAKRSYETGTICPSAFVSEHYLLTCGSNQVGGVSSKKKQKLAEGFALDLCISLGKVDGAGKGVTFIFQNERNRILDSCYTFGTNPDPFFNCFDRFFAIQIETVKDSINPNTGEVEYDKIKFLQKDPISGLRVLKETLLDGSKDSLTNIENPETEFHSLQIIWNPEDQRINVFFDEFLRLQICRDFPAFFDPLGLEESPSIFLGLLAATVIEVDTQAVGVLGWTNTCCQPSSCNNLFTENWTKAGYDGTAVWELSGDRRTVTETVNALPTLFTTTYDLINVDLSFEIRLDSVGKGDDDFVGMAWGIKDPICTDSIFDMWLFDWKGKHSPTHGCCGNICDGGYRINRIQGTIPRNRIGHYFFCHNESQTHPLFQVIEAKIGPAYEWEFKRKNTIRLIYTTTRTIIYLNGKIIFDQCGQYEPGRFGFYNYSQANVHYSNFKYKPYVQLELETDTICQLLPTKIKVQQDSCGFFGFEGIDKMKIDFGDGTTQVWDTAVFPSSITHTFEEAGNYRITLEMTSPYGCLDQKTILAKVHPFSPPDLGQDTTICEGAILFHNVANPTVPSASYLWQDGFEDPNYPINSAGQYWVNVSTNFCEAKDTLEVGVHPPLTLEIQTTASCPSDATGIIETTIQGGYGVYQLFLNDQAVSETLFEFLTPGTYQFDVKDDAACTISKDIIIETYPEILVDTTTLPLTCFEANDGEIIFHSLQDELIYSKDGNSFQGAGEFFDLPPGDYTIWVRDTNNCSKHYSFSFPSPIPLEVKIIATDTINFGETLVLQSSIDSAQFSDFHFEWSGEDLPCVHCPQAEIRPLTTSYYELTVTDNQGCQALAFHKITVLHPPPIFVPNAFSPNYDDINDQLEIYASTGVKEIKSWQIFSRWGAIVHEFQHFKPGEKAAAWDGQLKGRMASEGVYFYTLEATLLDGRSIEMVGDIVLIR